MNSQALDGILKWNKSFNKLDNFNDLIKSIISNYNSKGKFYEKELEKIDKELNSKYELINGLEAKLNIIAREKDNLKKINLSLIEENNDYKDKCFYFQEKFTNLQKWKENIIKNIEPIGNNEINADLVNLYNPITIENYENKDIDNDQKKEFDIIQKWGYKENDKNYYVNTNEYINTSNEYFISKEKSKRKRSNSKSKSSQFYNHKNTLINEEYDYDSKNFNHKKK